MSESLLARDPVQQVPLTRPPNTFFFSNGYTTVKISMAWALGIVRSSQTDEPIKIKFYGLKVRSEFNRECP